MTRTAWAVMLVASSAIGLPTTAQQPQAGQPAAKKSLYLRLGGYDTLARVVDDFLPRLRKDPTIAAMISGLADTSRMRNRQLIVDQLCHETGGPCLYIGRSMGQSHRGLGITDELWEFSNRAFGEALDAQGVKEPERAELLSVVEKLRPEIVEPGKAAPKKAP